MSELRDRLRALPAFPDVLPSFDIDAAPADPLELFRAWLDDAIASGERQPHALTVTTLDEHGAPASRTLIVKDVDERGIQVSSSLRSRKADHLRRDDRAGLLFFWRELGRQVEVSGSMVPLGQEESARDWRERPSFTGTDNPDWQVWALAPQRFEFLQATHDRAHHRLEYALRDGVWQRRRLLPSEALAPAGSAVPAT